MITIDYTGAVTYLDGLLYPRRGSGVFCAVDVREEHGVDQGGLSEPGLANDLKVFYIYRIFDFDKW